MLFIITDIFHRDGRRVPPQTAHRHPAFHMQEFEVWDGSHVNYDISPNIALANEHKQAVKRLIKPIILCNTAMKMNTV